MGSNVKQAKKNPYDSASFLNRLLFLWIFPIFKIGFRKGIDECDIYECCQSDDPETWASKLEAEWKKELEAGKSAHVKNAVFRAFFCHWIKGILLCVVGECLVRMIHPICIGIIVGYLSDPETLSQTEAQLAVAGVVMTSVVVNFLMNQGLAFNWRDGNNIRSALTHLIYRKVMKLSLTSLEQTDIGHVLNIIATDMNRFEDLSWHSSYCLSGPITIAFALAVTFCHLGMSTFAGFAIVFVLIPLQILMGFLFSRFRQATTGITDHRVGLMSEIISAMKLIKLYCWEFPFSDKLGTTRKKEIGTLKKTYVLEGINSTVYFVCAKTVLAVCLITFFYCNTPLAPATAFLVIAIINQIKLPANAYFPVAICLAGEACVTLDRVTKILLMDERDDTPKALTGVGDKVAITVESYSAKWTKNLNENNLSNITFNIKHGELLVIIGPVGAGKTCLVYSLLGETLRTAGINRISGRVSYAPQESWLFGGSIRENILLDNKFDRKRYKKVIQVCGLERDLSLFPRRDETFVGEKGHNLSGGQRARVSLARAVYHEADIYIMDDPLSAVDPEVANHIFDKCITEFLSEKTVVLVTHQLQFLKKADKIAFLRDGKLIAFGNHRELCNNNIEFNHFVEKKHRDEKERRESVSTLRSMSVVPVDEDGECFAPVRTRAKSRTQSIACMGHLESLESKEKMEDGQEDRDEKKSSGAVSGKVFWQYFMLCGGPYVFFFALIVSAVSQILYTFYDLWLAAWISKMDDLNISVMANINSSSSDRPAALPLKSKPIAHAAISENQDLNFIVYAGITAALVIVSAVRMIMVHLLLLQSSINLHAKVFAKLMRCKIDFFEKNPVGRILNRFTRDLGIIDLQIPHIMVSTSITVMEVIGIATMACMINYYILIPTVIVIGIAAIFRVIYLKSARDLYRLDSMSRSPVYHHMSSSYDGMIALRAFRVEPRFLQLNYHYLRKSLACRFLYCYASRSFAFYLDLVSTSYISAIFAIVLLAPPGMVPPADAGIILVQSLFLIGEFQYMIRLASEVENLMVSTERVLEYDSLPSEAELRIPGKQETDAWPSEGGIVFKRVSLRYSPTSEPVLKMLNFTIKPGEKVGIVGRTGAGKSSLISILFRLVEYEGEILIDNVDIKGLGLHELRQKLSIIPQDPSLFSGTVRSNLDPFSQHADDEMWTAIKEAHLEATLKPLGALDAPVTEGGSNLSVGQRQMLCMARALMKKNKILVLDEATANVDQATDELIQKMIKVSFKDFTVLTVAHRLNTVIEMDKILVMDAGRVIEFDEPHILLKNAVGLFYSMVKQTGPQLEKMLHTMAKNAAQERGLIRSLKSDRPSLAS